MHNGRTSWRREHACDQPIERLLGDIERTRHRRSARNLNRNDDAARCRLDDPAESTEHDMPTGRIRIPSAIDREQNVLQHRFDIDLIPSRCVVAAMNEPLSGGGVLFPQHDFDVERHRPALRHHLPSLPATTADAPEKTRHILIRLVYARSVPGQYSLDNPIPAELSVAQVGSRLLMRVRSLHRVILLLSWSGDQHHGSVEGLMTLPYGYTGATCTCCAATRRQFHPEFSGG